MDPPDTTAPLFGGNGDLAGAAAAVDLDEIFEDCFAANEWALLNDTLAAEALEPGPLRPRFLLTAPHRGFLRWTSGLVLVSSTKIRRLRRFAEIASALQTAR